jgi:hypothetical protein
MSLSNYSSSYPAPFPKDIWKLFFIYFENNFCSKTLNSLSLTCKKLNQINKERVKNHINVLRYKYVNIAYYISEFEYDYVTLKNCIIIDETGVYKSGESKGMKQSNNYGQTFLHRPYSYYFLDFFNSLRKLGVKSYSELIKMSDKDICLKLNCIYDDVYLVERQCEDYPYTFLFYVLSLLKNKGDIVNCIMEIQFT